MGAENLAMCWGPTLTGLQTLLAANNLHAVKRLSEASKQCITLMIENVAYIF
eukprot:SAG25_NODE_1653_length_2610_cov_2.271207_2_plen_51_part_01